MTGRDAGNGALPVPMSSKGLLASETGSATSEAASRGWALAYSTLKAERIRHATASFRMYCRLHP